MQRELANLETIKALAHGNIDREALKQYSGWGGLRKTIYEPSFYLQMKKYLSDDEILTIKKTLTNAYYTPTPIIKVMYEYLRYLGFEGGRIMEPGAGNGAFIEHMPKEIRQNSKIYAVELEPISAKILNSLYPDITVKNCGFETLDIKPVFDLVIGNPPYGKEVLNDLYNSDLNHLVIHHYFVAKSMRALKAGGLLAMVLPSYFLDNIKDHAREIIAAEGGSLISAFRLPDDLFDDAKVTVDLVFLKKESNGSKDWVNTSKIKVNGQDFNINNYYVSNNAHILGDLSSVWLKHCQRHQLTCKSNGNVFEQLKTFMGQFKTDLFNTNIHAENDQISEAIRVIDAKIEQLQKKRQQLLSVKEQVVSIIQQVDISLV